MENKAEQIIGELLNELKEEGYVLNLGTRIIVGNAIRKAFLAGKSGEHEVHATKYEGDWVESE